MSRIEPDVEAYGRYGRISALADSCELSSLSGRETKKSSLSDFIEDNGWNLRGLIDPTEHLDAEFITQDDAEDAADRVWSMLQQRSQFVGDAYPFEMTSDRFRLRDAVDLQSSPYVSLLAITIAHAYKLTPPVPAHEVFEAVVAAVFRAHVPRTVNLAQIRRDSGSFPEALERACAELDLKASPDAAPRLRYAQDEKADVISHCYLGDGRPGTWAIVGQVTCARTDDWDRKISETSSEAWRCFLGMQPPPVVYLAVPHHAEGEMIERLVTHYQRVVLDRIRIVRNKTAVREAGERELLDLVLASETLAVE